MTRHECPGNTPVCPSCGRLWEFFTQWADGSRAYTSKRVVERYHAIYGAPTIPFQAVA